ncbi:MAG TPA: GAF domain-containing protein [Tepidiformaceae bacterium]|nr:GAF domain-containing protein [Tepidiformaceae bacterium]
MTANDLSGEPLPFLIAEKLAEEMASTAELLVGISSLPEVLRRLAARAREITNSEYAAISTFDDAGVLDRFVFTGISESEAHRLGQPPTGRGLLGDLVRHDRPLRLDDLTTHPSFTGWPEGHPDMTVFLGVPIRAAGATIGSLYMTRTRGAEPFTTGDEIAAGMMALQAAVSVSTALARERIGRLALLEERVRIAHDLHDGTIQALYAIGLEVDSLGRSEGMSDAARTGLEGCVEHINHLISDIRTYIHVLEAETPAGPPDFSRDIAFILRQLVPEGVDTITSISASTVQQLEPRDVEDLTYIAREAVSNAIRHGSPAKIAVDLRESPTEITLTIQDNGLGFDTATVRHGLGSVTMRTRVSRLGGELTLLSIPGMGTTVRVQIPRGDVIDE